MHSIELRYLSVCVFDTTISRAKTAEPIEMSFGKQIAPVQGTVHKVGVHTGATSRLIDL